MLPGGEMTNEELKELAQSGHVQRQYIEITLVLTDYGCQRGDEDDGSGMPPIECSEENGWCIRCKALEDWARIADFISGSSLCD